MLAHGRVLLVRTLLDLRKQRVAELDGCLHAMIVTRLWLQMKIHVGLPTAAPAQPGARRTAQANNGRRQPPPAASHQ
jgi:hypothetical protein